MMSFLKWGFRATKTLTQSEDSIELKLKSGETVKFNQLVENLPSANTKEKLILHPLLFNGVLQTLYYGSANSAGKFMVYYGREIFKFSDDGICSLDWVIDKEDDEIFKLKYKESMPENWPKLFPRTRFFTKPESDNLTKIDEVSTKPIVVIFHGLAGGSHEPLIRNLAELLTTGKNKGKFDVVVNLARGCGRTKVTSGKLYHALSVEDIHEVLLEFKKRYPNRPIYTAGFSFGAVLLTNYLGMYNKNPLVKAATIVGVPFNLNIASDVMDTLYSGFFWNTSLVGFLCKLVKNNLPELNSHYPEIFNQQNLDKAIKFKTFRQFDDLITCKTAGFDNSYDYYNEGSPENRLLDIKTPFLAISSSDDPTSGKYTPYEKFKTNNHLANLETNLGGHLAFVTPSRQHWCVQVIDEFFEAFEQIED